LAKYHYTRRELKEAESYYLAEAGSHKANIMDTLAEIVNLLGEPARASEIMGQAVKENPESEYLQKQQVRFKKLADPKAQSRSH
jgi:hypothetical protein